MLNYLPIVLSVSFEVWDLCKIKYLQNTEKVINREIAVWDLCKIKYLQNSRLSPLFARYGLRPMQNEIPSNLGALFILPL